MTPFHWLFFELPVYDEGLWLNWWVSLKMLGIYRNAEVMKLSSFLRHVQFWLVRHCPLVVIRRHLHVFLLNYIGFQTDLYCAMWKTSSVYWTSLEYFVSLKSCINITLHEAPASICLKSYFPSAVILPYSFPPRMLWNNIVYLMDLE